MNYEQFEEKLSNIKDKNGQTNLLEHFTNVMSKLLLDNPTGNIFD